MAGEGRRLDSSLRPALMQGVLPLMAVMSTSVGILAMP